MKLYAEYIKEIFNRECYYDDDCFLTYNLYPEEKAVSIVDYYCVPEKRGQGKMLNLVTDLVENMSKEGYNTFYGYVDTDQNGWEYSERIMLKFGFEYLKTEDETYKHFILKIQESK